MFGTDATITYKDWAVGKFLGNGASARVYKVSRDGETSALKVFDSEIFSGDEEAQERLKRQAELVTKHHDNLADTKEVGDATVNGVTSPAILMEFCAGDSLEKPDVQKNLNEKDVRKIVAAIAEAAKFLLDEGYAHRDIKPANVMFDLKSLSTKLLDTGVIRPLSAHNDVSGHAFVGTKRYSPPEFLYRTEDGSPQCWTAITFYQIGATLYELIFLRQPYAQYKVKAQLIQAIANEEPDLSGIEKLPADIRHLLLCSLKRDWKTRFSILKWDDFTSLETSRTTLKSISRESLVLLLPSKPLHRIGDLDLRDRLLARVGERIRDPLLAANFVVKVRKEGDFIDISAGRSVKNFGAQQRVRLEIIDSLTYVGYIGAPGDDTQTESFFIAASDEDELVNEVSRRLHTKL